MYCFNVSNSIYDAGVLLSDDFKQSVGISSALLFVFMALLCSHRRTAFLQKSTSRNLILVGVIVVSALVCTALLALPLFDNKLRSHFLAFAGFCGAIAFVIPFAGWIRIVFGFTFARLLSITGWGLMVTGVLSSLLYMLPPIVSLFFVALLPIMCILVIILYSDKNSAMNCEKSTNSINPSPLILLALILVGSIVYTILTSKWMPAITANWMLFFIPCGFFIFIFAEVIRRKQISIEVSFAVCISAACCATLLALTPLFQSEFTYAFVFMVAWMLRLFSFDGSIWYGRQYQNIGLSVTFGAFGGIFILQFLCKFITRYFNDQDLSLLVIALVVLVFALILFLLAHIQDTKSQLQHSIHYEPDSYSHRTTDSRHWGLTEREQDVLELLSKGYSVKAIAEQLIVSENTVKFHRTNIYRKLNVNSRQELINLVSSSKTKS